MPIVTRRGVMAGIGGLLGARPASAEERGAALSESWRFARTGQGREGLWRAEADGAIAQVSDDPTDNRFPLAIWQPVVAASVAVSVRFRPVSGKVDQAGGIAVRLIDHDNYYLVRANALEDNVNFYRVMGGVRRQIKGVDVTVKSGVWHALGLTAEGDTFTVAYDGKTLFRATDRALTKAGRVALWTKADSVTWFDSVDIRALG